VKTLKPTILVFNETPKDPALNLGFRFTRLDNPLDLFVCVMRWGTVFVILTIVQGDLLFKCRGKTLELPLYLHGLTPKLLRQRGRKPTHDVAVDGHTSEV